MKGFFPNSRKSPLLDNGRVAIIMRTKDRPLLLARAFASVLSQTYENWCLCLVNDGGKRDDVERLVQRYRLQFGSRLVIRHHERSLGMEAASNAALNLAESDYVVVHDDDDSWSPEFLVRTVAFLERHDNASYGAVAARCEVIHEEIVADRVKPRRREPLGYWKERIDFMDMARVNSIPPICLLIRRYIVNIIGDFNHNLPVLGDWDYSLRIMAVCDIGTINDDLAYYHHRRNSGALYGNSVHSGIDKHLTYQVLYRNSMVRAFLQADPSRLALLHLMLLRFEQVEQNFASRFAHTDERLRALHKHLDWTFEQIGSRHGRMQQEIARTIGETNKRIDRVERQLADAIRGIDRRLDVQGEQCQKEPAWARELVKLAHQGLTMLRPVAWVWRLMKPVRKAVAKLRGRA